MEDKKDKSFSVKPFTKDAREQSLFDVDSEFDERRTICNVVRLIFKNAQADSYNIGAIRELALEAMWMGKRMNTKLTKLRQDEMKEEYIAQDESHLNYNSDFYPAQGNWD